MNTPPSKTAQPPKIRLADETIKWQGSTPLDKLAFLSMFYLGMPLAFFFGGWLKISVGIVLLFALMLGFILLWRICRIGTVPFRFEWIHLVFLGVAIVWVSFGGAGHFLYANRFDWSLRDAVLRDLTVAIWPPGYDVGGTVLWILRCPVGYFLPAAVAGKIFGLSCADTFLWIWTLLGIWIFLSLLPINTRHLGRISLAILIVVLFSGMDILGWWILYKTNPPIYKHIEWWADLFQYSSNTTLLFWTPNHALPGWIAAALFWRHWKTDGFISIAPLLLALLPLWSPFPIIGMLPFCLLLLVRLIRENKWRTIHWPLLGISVLLVAVVGAFLSNDIGNIPGGSALNQIALSDFFVRYALFALLEFAILSGLIWIFIRSQFLLSAVAVLLLLPFIQFGPSNDLAMRASIPALMFICISTIVVVQQPLKGNCKIFIPLVIVLLLGAITPAHEFYRAAVLPSWKPSLTANIMTAPPAHYVARVTSNWRRYVFRDPGEIIKTSTGNRPLYLYLEELP
jgi:hypothetical protein